MKYSYHLLKKPIPNGEITARARAVLRGNWGPAILISFLIPLLFGIVQQIMQVILGYSCGSVMPLIIIMITSVITVTGNFYSTLAVPVWFLSLHNQSPKTATESLKTAFSRFTTSLLAGILSGVIIFLKLLLFIIPGIMAAYDYMLVYCCIADDPNLTPSQALKRSRAIMHGHRWQYFCLSWRFFGWGLLCLLTLGIGFIWLIPYIIASTVEFYYSVMPQEYDEEFQELPPSGNAPAYLFAGNLCGFIIVVLFSVLLSCGGFFCKSACKNISGPNPPAYRQSQQ